MPAPIPPAAASKLIVRPDEVPAALAQYDEDSVALSGGIQRARDYFTSLGVGPQEGNGPVPLQLAPAAFEAAYQSTDLMLADGGVQRTDERIVVGRNPYTGTSFARAPEVLAHEYAHRIEEHIVPTMSATPASRIIDEHIADVFASAIDGSWTIGHSILPGGLRSLEDPSRQRVVTKDGEIAWKPTVTRLDEITPATMELGPYPNLGPLNNAAYRIGTRIGQRDMARIYLQTLRNHITAASGITELVVGTVQSARELFPGDPSKALAVQDAWKAVGARPAAVDSI